MDQLWKKIIWLNLKSVRERFAASRSWWWHLTHKPAQIEKQYRQLLYLIAAHPERTIVAWSSDVYDFWCQHQSDRKKFAADCAAFAGPGSQLNAPKRMDRTHLTRRAMAKTRELYLHAFGESARKRRQISDDFDCGAEMPCVFSDSRASGYDSSSGQHHPGHHGGGHQSGGHHASADHGGGGHSSCGGHSGCGGHGH